MTSDNDGQNDDDDDSTDEEHELDHVAKRPRREWSPGPQVPPAPPSTPASLVEARTPHGPIPLIPYIQNADALERDQLASGELATPAPTKSNAAVMAKNQLDDFYQWTVGSRYELIRMLGRGSYGQVAQAKDLWDDNRLVAIKRIASAFEQEVDAVRLYREIHILTQLRGHDCIIRLLNVIEPESLEQFTDLYLVFEYVDTDLYKLIMSPQYLTTEHIQTFLYQMLAGLKFIHSSSVIHRDLKPANILLNEDCSLKICDFGLARIVDTSSMSQGAAAASVPNGNLRIGQLSPKGELETNEVQVDKEGLCSTPKRGLTRQLTKHVVTRWYRAPELILVQPYTSAVDIWSIGCILAELLSMQEGNYQDRSPLFPGGSCYPLSGKEDGGEDDRLDQLNVILEVLGTPNAKELEWVGTKGLDYINGLGPKSSKTFETMYPVADPGAIDLLRQMLHFNPKNRITASEALEHDFFKTVRRKEFELDGAALEGPAFLEASTVDLETLRQKTFEEVMWYSKQNSGQERIMNHEVAAINGKATHGGENM